MVKIIATVLMFISFNSFAQSYNAQRIKEIERKAKSHIENAKKSQEELDKTYARSLLIKQQIEEQKKQMQEVNFKEILEKAKEENKEEEVNTPTQEKTNEVLEQVTKTTNSRTNVRQGFGKVE